MNLTYKTKFVQRSVMLIMQCHHHHYHHYNHQDACLIFVEVTNEMKSNQNVHVHTNILCSQIAWLIEAGRRKLT